MRASASSCARSRRRKGWPSRPTSSAHRCAEQRRDREVVGPGRAVGDQRRRRRARGQRLEHRSSGRAVARRRRAPRRRQRARPSRRGTRRARRRPASFCSASTLGRRTGAPPTRARRGAGRGTCSTIAHLLDRRAVDLLDLADQQLERDPVGAAAPRTRRPRRRSPRSSTSMPTMSPPTAPMRDATRPSAPGRSGSHTRTRTLAGASASRRRARHVREPCVRPESVGAPCARMCPRDDSRMNRRAFRRLRASDSSEGRADGDGTDRRVRRHVRSRARRARRRGVRGADGRSASTACCSSSPATRGRSGAGSWRRRRAPRARRARDRRDRRRRGLARSRSSARARRSPPTRSRRCTGRGRELFLVLGADAVANMRTWRRLDDTRHLATVVVHRAGRRRPTPSRPARDGGSSGSPIPRLDISSTDLRRRLAAGRPIDGLVPPAVVRGSRHRGLYTGPLMTRWAAA